MIIQNYPDILLEISQVSDIMKEVPVIKENIIYVLHEDIITKSFNSKLGKVSLPI